MDWGWDTILWIKKMHVPNVSACVKQIKTTTYPDARPPCPAADIQFLVFSNSFVDCNLFIARSYLYLSARKYILRLISIFKIVNT